MSLSAISSVTGLMLAVKGMRREDRAAPSPSLSLAPRPPDIRADQVPSVDPEKAMGARAPSFAKAKCSNPGTY